MNASTAAIPDDVKDRIAAAKGDRTKIPKAPKTMDDLPPEIRKQLEDAASDNAPAKVGKRAAKYVSLERELAALLSLPALPCDAMGDEFCAKHFASQGPILAAQLAIYSESHKATYDVLIRLTQAGGILTLSLAVGMYALPPILHHAGGPDALKDKFGVPHTVRSTEDASEHGHPSE